LNAAETITCANNLKNLGLSQIQYGDDYDDYLAYLRTPVWHGQICSWMMQLHPYITGEPAPFWPSRHNTEIFACPTVREEGQMASWGWWGELSASYGQNASIGNKGKTPAETWYANWPEMMFNKFSEVGVPSGTHLISDNGFIPDVGGTSASYWWRSPTSYMREGPQRHSGESGGNIVFIDGHVSFLQKEFVLWGVVNGGAPDAVRQALFDQNQAQ
jgi:prepilin-type processing-associated H-X9-DG protein